MSQCLLFYQWGGHLHRLPASGSRAGAECRAGVCVSWLQDWILVASDSGWPGIITRTSLAPFPSGLKHLSVWLDSNLCICCFFFVFLLKSSKIKKGSKGDTSVLQPTLMAAVPVRPPQQDTQLSRTFGKLYTMVVWQQVRMLSDLSLQVFSETPWNNMWVLYKHDYVSSEHHYELRCRS